MRARRALAVGAAIGSAAGAVLLRRRAPQPRPARALLRRRLARHARAGHARGRAPSASRARAARGDPRPVNRAELGAALREHAYLEGDFVLRSGRRSRYYLDKYRFETVPELLGPLGELIAETVREHEPEAVRLAGPELGAVALAAAASLASRPAVPDRAQGAEGVRHGEPARGRLRAGRARVPGRGRRHLRRRGDRGGRGAAEAGLEVGTAVCVVDREEGGADALARVGVRLRALFRPTSC